MTESESDAQERIGLEVTVCENGVVNVHRPESDRAHSVFVDDNGGVVRCSCKGHRFHGHCAHQDAVDGRPIVTSVAAAAGSTYSPTAVTDGGTEVEGRRESTDSSSRLSSSATRDDEDEDDSDGTDVLDSDDDRGVVDPYPDDLDQDDLDHTPL